jgi:hypothetical protein
VQILTICARAQFASYVEQRFQFSELHELEELERAMAAGN